MTSIKELRCNSSAGPDGVPAVLLKKACGSIALPLSLLWNKSMEVGEIPRLYKKGNISPIYKGGNRTLPKNYRPVTLTSHIIKLFEKVIVKKMANFMDENALYNNQQHGFRSRHSCLSQLIDHFQQIIVALNEGKDVDVIYLDFAKAFDKVDHNILLRKLFNMGIRGRLYNWIKSFLLDRKQMVNIEGSKSQEFDVASGVPQGSVLGPLLFIIHISDINALLQSTTVRSFADDTRLVKNIENVNDCQGLQEDLEKIFDWAERNNMTFNSGKFELMRYTQQTDPVEFEYKTKDGCNINRTRGTKDLGVFMSDDGKFHEQIMKSSLCGKKKAGWICRVFNTRNEREMLILYKALVLPLLEYCCPLWCPTNQNVGLIRALENVQRSFTRRIWGMTELNYWDRLKKLKLYSLERRRERYCIIYVWKILHNMAPNFTCDKVQEYTDDRRGLLCRVPSLIRRATQRLKTIRDGTFGIQGPKLFNCLPRELRARGDTEDPELLEKFKRKLDKFLATIPDEPRLPSYPSAQRSNSITTRVGRVGDGRGGSN